MNHVTVSSSPVKVTLRYAQKGERGIGISNVAVDDQGHLIVTYDNGKTQDAGAALGDAEDKLQVERTVSLAEGVTCSRGTLLGYKAGGFVKADQKDFTTMADVVIALGESHNGKVKVLEQG